MCHKDSKRVRENKFQDESESGAKLTVHGSALEGSDPHELAPGFEVCQMKGTHIVASELTLSKSYEIGLLMIIRPLCFWTIK